MQTSYFWSTDGVGDGKAEGYGAADWASFNRMLWTADDPEYHGVSKNHLNEMVTTNPAGQQLIVDTGGAMVYGIPYENTAPVTFDTGIPLVNLTGWRIALRASWVAQTVRLVLIVNTDGVAAYPTLTHTPGVIWELPIAAGSVTVGGVVNVDQGPWYLSPGLEVDHTNILDRIRTIFVPCSQAVVAAAVIPRVERGWPMADAVQTYCYGTFLCPIDHESPLTFWIMPVWFPSATSANLARLTQLTNYGADAALYNTHTFTNTFDLAAGVQDTISTGINHSVGASITWEDYVTLTFDRNGAHANDTFAGIVYFMGWRIYYMADM